MGLAVEAAAVPGAAAAKGVWQRDAHYEKVVKPSMKKSIVEFERSNTQAGQAQGTSTGSASTRESVPKVEG